LNRPETIRSCHADQALTDLTSDGVIEAELLVPRDPVFWME